MAGRAVVTGGGRGIGAAIVERLRSDGYEVVVLDALAGAGVVQCDITDPDQVRAAAYQIGPVDVIVNNAGAWRFGALEDVSAQDFAVVHILLGVWPSGQTPRGTWTMATSWVHGGI